MSAPATTRLTWPTLLPTWQNPIANWPSVDWQNCTKFCGHLNGSCLSVRTPIYCVKCDLHCCALLQRITRLTVVRRRRQRSSVDRTWFSRWTTARRCRSAEYSFRTHPMLITTTSSCHFGAAEAQRTTPGQSRLASWSTYTTGRTLISHCSGKTLQLIMVRRLNYLLSCWIVRNSTITINSPYELFFGNHSP